eukprot:scaffold108565_cov17-Tisochrysis_lutea.AAC.1
MSCTAVQGKGAWSGCAFGIAQRPPPSMTRGWHECTCSCAGLCAQSKGSIWAGTWARFKPRTPAENEDKDWKLKINVRQQALAWLGHSCRGDSCRDACNSRIDLQTTLIQLSGFAIKAVHYHYNYLKGTRQDRTCSAVEMEVALIFPFPVLEYKPCALQTVTLHEQRFSNRFLQSCCCGSQQGPPPFPAKPLAQQH